MSSFETHDMEGYADSCCFGRWDISYPACTTGKCLIAKYCEEKAKKGLSIQEESTKIQEIVLTEEDKKLPEIPPLEYMLDLLQGKFEHEKKENSKAIAHYFMRDGLNMFTIIISRLNGKIKLMSSSHEPKVVDSIDSIEQVEEIIKEMIG